MGGRIGPRTPPSCLPRTVFHAAAMDLRRLPRTLRYGPWIDGLTQDGANSDPVSARRRQMGLTGITRTGSSLVDHRSDHSTARRVDGPCI